MIQLKPYENALVEMYDKLEEYAGVYTDRGNGTYRCLLPVRHIFTSAGIEVLIDKEGNFLGAFIVPTNDARTITGASDDSAQRSSKIAANFPFDNLEYMASDMLEYYTRTSAGGKDNSQDTVKRHAEYLRQLDDVITFAKGKGVPEYRQALETVTAIRKYTADHKMAGDLIATGDEEILELLKAGKDKKEFNNGVVIRFRVSGAEPEECWKNRNIHKPWIDYLYDKDSHRQQKVSIFSGKLMATGSGMPTKLLGGRESAKTHSANFAGTWDFTFKGRFEDPNDIATIGALDMSKMYNMLKYIVDESCRNMEDFYLCVWDTARLAPENRWQQNAIEAQAVLVSDEGTVAEFIAGKHNLSDVFMDLSGSKSISNGDWTPDGDIMIIGIRKTLPGTTKGRLSVVEYRVISKGEYLERIRKWHTEGGWYHREYVRDTGVVTYFGMPKFSRMADLVLGREDNGYVKIMKGQGPNLSASAFYQAVMKAILYGEPLPRQFMDMAVEKASNPARYKKWYNHEAVLTLACSLVCKQYKLGNMEDLQVKENDRNYLFGQLWALAYCTEYFTFSKQDKENGRRTNAENYMSAFRLQPLRVWTEVYEKVCRSYMRKLSYPQRAYLTKRIDEIIGKFNPDDFCNQKLSGVYLCGYSTMKNELMAKREIEPEEDTGIDGEADPS